MTSETGAAELESRIDARAEVFTPAERALADWFRQNPAAIPYETGAGIAYSIGVSEMTVIRFVRALGYANLRDLKARLRPQATAEVEALDDVAERFTSQRLDIGQLTESLERELASIQRAYAAATTDSWREIVALLAQRPHVYVAGFQATQGVALDFASRLKYVRPGVRFAEGSAGVYSEILENDPAETLLVIVDTASYARKGVLLARKVKERAIPMVIVTDRFSHWAREYSDHVLEMSTHVGTFWDSTASLATVLNLLIHSAAAQLGDAAASRFDAMVALGDHFAEFDAQASRTHGVKRRRVR